MENALLTSSSMQVLIRALNAAIPQPEQSTEEVTTEPAQDATDTPESEQGSDPTAAPEQGGCGSCKSVAGLGLGAMILSAGAVCFKRKKRK